MDSSDFTSKTIVVIGMTAEEIGALRQSTPPAVKIVAGLITDPRPTSISPDAPAAFGDRAPLMRQIAEADGLIGGPSREMIQAGAKLKWVQILSAEVRPYLYPEVVDSGIVMTNARGVAAPAVADHGLAMLLALTRKLTHFVGVRSSERFERARFGLLELKGNTAVVIGVGNIGGNVAQRLHGFEMNVIGVDPCDIPVTQWTPRVVTPDCLDEILPRAGVVFLCASSTPRTDRMMGARQFSLMPSGSYFIALSRGATYDMDALVEALASGHLAGAGVDVTSPEPLPAGHRLWSFDNVIITYHCATESQMEMTRRLILVKENLLRFAAGRKLLNIVDKQKGY
jgi:phosphoglycerate dehydrogenase-like enzyme